MDFAITNAILVTMEGKGTGIIQDGAIGIENDMISYIGPTKDLEHSNVDRLLDGSGKLILPGFINAHFHSTSSILRGTAQDVPEIQWMNKAIGPLSKHLTTEDRLLGSKIAVIEGLRTGTTTFAEYTSGVAELFDKVYKPLRTRVIAAENINEITTDRGKMGPQDLYPLDPAHGEASVKRNLELIEKSKSEDLLDAMYGPQAVDMVTRETLEKINELSNETGNGIHMHVDQGERERIQVEKRYRKSTISFLDDIDMLSNRLLAAHIHGTTSEERSRMIDNDVKMVSCQSSISMIDGIVPPLKQYTDAGGIAGIGTDQIPGVGHCNMIKEMRTGAILAKTSTHDPTALPPWKMLEFATLGGAKALGVEDKIGSVKVGKKADFITINTMSPNLLPSTIRPLNTVIPNLIYSGTGYEVDNVVINGKFVIRNSSFVNPIGNYLHTINKKVVKLLNKAEDDWRNAGSKMVEYHDQGLL